MKHLKISLFAAIVMLCSCEKEEVNSIEEVNQIVTTENTQSRAAGNRVFYDNGAIPGVEGVDYGCKGSGGNCLPTVVVVGIANPQVVGGLLDTLENGDVIAVLEFVKEHKRELSEVIPTDLINGVIQQHLFIKNKGNTSENDTVYLRFIDRNGNAKSVIPMKR